MGFSAVLKATNVNEFEWATPIKLYEELDKEFHFTLDPCCSGDNHKCEKYYTKEDDGLTKDWAGEIVFMNPPYGKQTSLWVEKAFHTHTHTNTVIVGLLPVRTDTKWFHDYIYNKAEIRFIKGRLHYNDGKSAAPFPSMIVIWRKDNTKGENDET